MRGEELAARLQEGANCQFGGKSRTKATEGEICRATLRVSRRKIEMQSVRFSEGRGGGGGEGIEFIDAAERGGERGKGRIGEKNADVTVVPEKFGKARGGAVITGAPLLGE